jgi:hypothetical protein
MKKKFFFNVCMSCRKSLKNRRNFFGGAIFLGGTVVCWSWAHYSYTKMNE